MEARYYLLYRVYIIINLIHSKMDEMIVGNTKICYNKLGFDNWKYICSKSILDSKKRNFLGGIKNVSDINVSANSAVRKTITRRCGYSLFLKNYFERKIYE